MGRRRSPTRMAVCVLLNCSCAPLSEGWDMPTGSNGCHSSLLRDGVDVILLLRRCSAIVFSLFYRCNTYRVLLGTYLIESACKHVMDTNARKVGEDIGASFDNFASLLSV